MIYLSEEKERKIKRNQNMPSSSFLTLIIGPMMAGKSEALLARIRQYTILQKRVLVVNSARDNRYASDAVATHFGAQAPAVCVSRLSDIPGDMLASHDVILVDEGHFFPDLKECVTAWLKEGNHQILVAGLKGDYQCRAIGQILELVPEADELVVLHALCSTCATAGIHKDAPFTRRLVASGEQLLVGGADLYSPVCRAHIRG
jgi:thymidine kinase